MSIINVDIYMSINNEYISIAGQISDCYCLKYYSDLAALY